ncbi:extracellular solute-binding protein [Dactylosporangium sp. CA-233914]|uniref:ABC transporter substrate-binding protein n=1 Tax=Dactylosporangium sp. CA-233914 TaxID=3239934 RepID=UPI003D8D59BD
MKLGSDMHHRGWMLGGLASISAATLVLAGCSGNSSNSAIPTTDTGDCSTITVLTNRTDQVDTNLAAEAKVFEKANPKVKVKIQGIADYANDVRTRLNSKNYGDVLNIPQSITPSQFPAFFTPLGSEASLSSKYHFTGNGSYEGQVYGISFAGLAGGLLINTEVMKKAGITEPPKTPAEFMSALQAIKAKTDAVPLYTNYHDGWPLQGWVMFDGLIKGADTYIDRTKSKSLYENGSELNVAGSILFDAVHDGLTEADPATTDWPTSLTMLASGKIAVIPLAQFAVPQAQQAATTAGLPASDIGFWPLPIQKDGKYQAQIVGDYQVAINKHSKCQATARKWVDFYLDESGFANAIGEIPPLKTAKAPAILDEYTKLGVQYVEIAPSEKYQQLSKAAGLQFLADPTILQKLIDVARGAASGTKQSYFESLDARWAQAVATNG